MMIKRFYQYFEKVDQTKMMIEDLFLEYADDYDLFSSEHDLEDMSEDQRKDKAGFYRVSDLIKPSEIQINGFPNLCTGYKVTLTIMRSKYDESQFKVDMMKFIERVCKSLDFKYKTYFIEIFNADTFTIAFYRYS